MRNRVILIAIIALLIGVAFAVGRLVPGGDEGPVLAPLEGELVHDFGNHRMSETMLKLEHTFRLRNKGNRTLHILDVVSTCGCAVADIDRRTVAPGATLAIPVTLTLQQPVRRNETIWVQIAGYDSVRLRVSGAAQRIQNITAATSSILLDAEEEKTILLIATDYATDLEPPRPRVETPAAVQAKAGEWRQIFTGEVAKGRPARWEAVVTVRSPMSAPIRGSKLLIHFDPELTLEIDLSGRPWARNPNDPPFRQADSEDGKKDSL